jgi:two-component system sensor histidine kinase TctE
VRVALLEVDYGELASPQRLRVQVAKSLAVRDRIAKELVADMLLPLLVLGALISTLVYFGIGRGLRPLQRLEALLEGRSGKSLTALAPIELNEAPLEVHSLAAALNQMLGAVSKSVSQEKRFLSDAAHQLRTPLAGLISQTELALQAADDAALRARLEKVHAGATRSAHLVHQLLALARSEGAVQLRDVDLAQLARDVARLWTPKALARKMDLGFEGADHVWIKGEQLLLQEALSNLLDNALLYAGAGAIVTVRVREQTPWAILEVEDSGPGLPPADRERVFERFWRGSDAPGGCGLGLAIVSEIAERHGGQARALEVPEQGFCLRLQLPLRPPD